MGRANFFEHVMQDLRYAFRILRRSPGFTLTAIAALALGIGATTAIFTLINTVLLQPLSYPEPDRIVQLELSSPRGTANTTSIPKFNVWREQKKAFQYVAAYDSSGPGVNLTGGDRPEQLKGIHVSADYFSVFGAPLATGRTFSIEEDNPGGAKLAVLSYGLWQRRFGGDAGVSGKTIEIGGEPYQVIGVLGASFKTDPPADIFLPLQADPNSTNQAHFLRAAARLKPGVTLGMAQDAMKLAAEEFKQKFPGVMGPQLSFTAVPLRDTVIGDVRKAFLILMGAVAFVLLIACANVANLLLVRATLRGREIAVRAALGAGRGRIIRQLLTESVLLSVAGGALGLVLGYIGLHALLAINPGDIPRIGPQGSAVTLDWRVLAFTLLISLFTGILFGLIPAFNASRSDLSATLRETGARSGAGLRQNKARSILVITEMALALVLLVGAALMIRTFMELRAVNPGFDARNVLIMDMSLTGARFEKSAAVAQVAREAQRRLENLPGIEAVSTTCCLPLEGGLGLPFQIEGRASSDPQNSPGASWSTISPHYFESFHIPLLRGRLFTDNDDASAERVVVINEALARQYWPNENAVGQRITIGAGVGPAFAEPAREIVGIVGDVRSQGLDTPPDPTMYVPVAQVNDAVTALNNGFMPITWIVRTKVEPFSLSTDIQRELRVASGGLPVGHIRSMQQVIGESTNRTDFNMTLLNVFAGVALLLAAIGIYGLMAYSVQQRTQEIGIRLALGAGPRDVRNMVVKEGMLLALIGVFIGVGAALGLTRFISSMLYGVKAWDPVVFVFVTALLSFVALIATYVPARRAAQVDPMVSLRYE
jgi:putative ABC transport system permease protein